MNQSFGYVHTTAYAKNLDVRLLQQTDARTGATSDYLWVLSLPEFLSSESQLRVVFPREFSLEQSTYECALGRYRTPESALGVDSSDWSSSNRCASDRNSVSVSQWTDASIASWTSAVSYKVAGVANPVWGLPRSQQGISQDFDVADFAVWTEKFSFFVYTPQSQEYSARSYSNVNAAYAGFSVKSKAISVNDYSPLTKANRILVYPGTQTQDILISTASDPATSVKLTFRVTAQLHGFGSLKFTSQRDNWTLLEGMAAITFRVAASLDMEKGLYYLEWAKQEERAAGLTEDQYQAPPSTLLEVATKTAGKFLFIVDPVLSVPVGLITPPVKVAITNAPHSDVTVVVQSTEAGIAVYPQALTFGPDKNVGFFQVHVEDSYSSPIGTSHQLLLTLTGTDAFAYSIASSVSFTTGAPARFVIPGEILTWGFGTPTHTRATSSPVTSQAGVLYYQLAAKGAPIPSFADLKASRLTCTSNSVSPDPMPGERWVDFQRRLYAEHLSSVCNGKSAGGTLVFDWLYAGTTYRLAGYLDNSIAKAERPAKVEFFTTLPVSKAQPFSVVFQGVVPESFDTAVVREVARIQGVSPLRLLNHTYSANSTSSIFSYTLVPNRYDESPSPTEQVQIFEASLELLRTALSDSSITNALQAVTIDPVLPRVQPQWAFPPSTTRPTTRSLRVSLRASVAGETCCVAVSDSSGSPSAEQILLGLDQANVPSRHACIPTDVSAEVDIVLDDLESETNHSVFCTAADSYPLWPTLIPSSPQASHPCPPTCLTCTGLQCTSCFPNAQLPSSKTSGSCSCSTGFYPHPDTANCASCAHSCGGWSTTDCIETYTAEIYFAQAGEWAGLPYLKPTQGLICHRKPIPSECNLGVFMDKIGLYELDSSRWELTTEQCNKYTKFTWPYSDWVYSDLFRGLTMPGDLYDCRVQRLEFFLRTWVMQFGNFQLRKNLQWQAFLRALVGVGNWAAVAAWGDKSLQFFDGSAVLDFPPDLAQWISSTGSREYECLNAWNGAPQACFQGTCTSEAVACCAAVATSRAPCCTAHASGASSSS